jgi:hypothetical protein
LRNGVKIRVDHRLNQYMAQTVASGLLVSERSLQILRGLRA